ncbi:MAG: hypothetical protein OK457_05035 [Thaumarchaeota archaeon]|nr:hypothetical protein [Nitrososphaerota archaeon]
MKNPKFLGGFYSAPDSFLVDSQPFGNGRLGLPYIPLKGIRADELLHEFSLKFVVWPRQSKRKRAIT